MNSIVKLILCVTILAEMSCASSELLVGRGSSSLVIKPSTRSECVTFIERYTRHLLQLYDEEQQSYYLITQNFEFGARCFEGYDPTTVTVMANKLDVKSGQVSKETVWTFTTKGIRGERTDYPLAGLYSVVDLELTGEITKYFSLSSGAFIGSSSFQPLAIEAPDMSKVLRFIFVYENKRDDYVGDAVRIATIYYADNKNLKQELAITLSKPSSVPCKPRQLRFADAEDGARLRTLSDETLDGFSITVELACEHSGVSVEVPVVDDMLLSDKATVTGSHKIRIIDISPEKLL